MAEVLRFIGCVIIMLSLARSGSKYIEEGELMEIVQRCGMQPDLGIDILVNLGIVKPYRPGIYAIS